MSAKKKKNAEQNEFNWICVRQTLNEAMISEQLTLKIKQQYSFHPHLHRPAETVYDIL